MDRRHRLLRTLLAAALPLTVLLARSADALELGAARIDVTPAVPIRLTGYGNRTNASNGVEQKLWAKALALGGDQQGPAVLLTLDNCGISEGTYLEVARRLEKKGRIRQDRLVIACSHTHTGPCTTGWAPNIFSKDIAPDEQAVIDGYTRDLIDKLEQVALAALRNLRPGSLAWTQGSVGFARNRRVVVGNTAQFGDNAAGPVDSSLPMLIARGANGELRAVVANYACHCTTLGGEFNHVCGDWAGYAQQAIEREQPGAVAMITIGCGADANPSPRGGADGGLGLAKKHGEELAAEVKRLLGRTVLPLPGPLETAIKHIELPFGPQFSREEWQERAQRGGIVGYHARRWLARLDRGARAPDSLSYYVQRWNFGNDLAVVFLNGEVVVDYALRLKQELDPARLWVSGYANYVPCYIPSRRILAEGGYEAEDSLWYYDRPARLSTNIENQIIQAVHELVPKSFLLDSRKAELPGPRTPAEALATFRTSADLVVELAVSEPLIESPVAIDWGADGRLWVCEMVDYPAGIDGRYKPGGRIKVLTSSHADGRYDRAQLFLEGLAFPTGVMPWGRGALICAAPDILYAEDIDGDGRADVVRTNFTGFATHNFQARVNGFTWGLDGWLHGSSGLFGGKVRSLTRGDAVVDLSGRDFRCRPETGSIEPVAGLSQMGRVRDAFGNWFGNDNSTLLWHYPLPDHELRRNPHAVYPEPRVLVPRDADANRLFPASRTLERFNDPQMANHTTSACGPEIYRDTLLGDGTEGQAFLPEPVHNLVTRLELLSDGVTFAGRRVAGEERAEFLASTDNWFRPVQARTGPDGALWIVDMYRFVIEHPRWIPPDRLKSLDPRAGADKGRLYRVFPRGAKLRPIRDLTQLNDADLARALDTPNGPTRDLVQARLVGAHPAPGPPAIAPRPPTPAAATSRAASAWPVILRRQAAESSGAAVRVQALATLGLTGELKDHDLATALRDPHAAVRTQALRELETTSDASGSSAMLSRHPDFLALLESLAGDPAPGVRFQLALSLGNLADSRCGALLGRLALAGMGDPWLRAAVLSSASRHGASVLRVVAGAPDRGAAHLVMAKQLFAALPDGAGPGSGMLAEVVRTGGADALLWRFGLSQAWIEARERQGRLPLAEADLAVLEPTLSEARRVLANDGPSSSEKVAAMALVGRNPQPDRADLSILSSALRAGTEAPLRQAALEGLRRRHGAKVSGILLKDWGERVPAERGLILSLLVSREEWAIALLDALEQHRVTIPEVSLVDRQALLKSSHPLVRTRALKVFEDAHGTTRAEVLSRYNGVGALAGVPDLGALVFEKLCAQCHALRGRGQSVGPNLQEFAGKSVSDFLVAILDPNAAVNPNFPAYLVELKDGRALSGLVRGETAASLTVVQGGGVQEQIPRSEVREIRASSLSLMPEGLEEGITPQDLADLIAWIKKAAPAPFGGASPDQVTRARAEFLEGGMNGLAKVLTAVEHLPYPSWLGRLPLAYCRQNGSTLAWRTGQPGPANSSGVLRFRLPAAMGHVSQPPGGFSLKLNGRPVLEFNVTLSDASWRSADGRVRMDYTVIENNSEDSNGVIVIEVSSALVRTGEPVEFSVEGTSSGSLRWFGLYVLAQNHL